MRLAIVRKLPILATRALSTRALPKLKTYKLRAACVGGRPASVSHTTTGHEIATDLPRAMGGRDEAPQPVELLLAALLGCKSATAHYVARHLWPREHNKLEAINFVDVVAERDDRGAIALPICEQPPVAAGLLRVRGTALVTAHASISPADVAALGELVEERCPVAATLARGGCELDFEWRLA